MIGELKSDAARNTLAYLDNKIRHWRVELRKRFDRRITLEMSMAEAEAIQISQEKAISYIDAYQTMRCDLFGEALPDGA